MAQILVRGLDEQVKQALVRRAAANSRSMEAEVREILTQAVAPHNVALQVMERVQAEGGIPDLADLPIPERSDPARGVDLG